jgi:hypothetical protein
MYDASPPAFLESDVVVYCAYASCMGSDNPGSKVLVSLQDMARGTNFEAFANYHMYYKILYIDTFLDHLQSMVVRCVLEQTEAECVIIPDGTGRRVCSANMTSAWTDYDPVASPGPAPFSWPHKPSNTYSVLDYSNRVKHAPVANSGDEVQSIAAAQFVPAVFKLVDRDAGVTASHETFIANAWWGSNFKWPPPDDAHPLILAAHYSAAGMRVLKQNADWFKNHYNKEVGLVGARDFGTLHTLKALGIRSYFSACLTLTFDIKAPTTERKHVVIADIPKMASLPAHVRANAIVLQANVGADVKDSRTGRLAWAFQNLRTIGEQARLVVTSRIHIALPAMAQGVPVVFVTADDSALPGGGGGRTAGLASLFHRFDSRKGPNTWTISTTSPPPNPGNHKADRYRAAQWHYIKTHMRVDAVSNAQVYGVIPFQRLGKNEPLVSYPTQNLFHLILSTNASSVTGRMLRQAEQIFYHHPNAKLIVHAKQVELEETPYITLAESGYDIRTVRYTDRDLHDCFKMATGEPMSKLEHFKRGQNWYSHETDLLRYCIMFTEGGVYLDTDMHVIKPFPADLTNSVGYQDSKQANGAAMIFEKGSEFARAALNWIAKNPYHPNDWEIWGPVLITKLVKKFNGQPNVVRVLGQNKFQPFPWQKVRNECFAKKWSEGSILEKLIATYAIHLNSRITQHYQRSPQGTLSAWMFNRYCIFCGEDLISW